MVEVEEAIFPTYNDTFAQVLGTLLLTDGINLTNSSRLLPSVAILTIKLSCQGYTTPYENIVWIRPPQPPRHVFPLLSPHGTYVANTLPFTSST